MAPPATEEVEAVRLQVQGLLADRARLQRELKGRPIGVTGKRAPSNESLAVVLPFAAGDAVQAARLVQWWVELAGGEVGSLAKAPLLLAIVPHAVPDAQAIAVVKAAQVLFTEVEIYRPPFDLPDEKWPIGSCWSFLFAAQWCAAKQRDFLWCEPDCIALRPDWLPALDRAWSQHAKPFMGVREPACPHGSYPEHMAGCGVYTWETARFFKADRLGDALDIALAPHVAPRMQETPLIAQIFGRPGPPEFRCLADLQQIPGEAVLFHRNKDGRLISLLREQRANDAAP